LSIQIDVEDKEPWEILASLHQDSLEKMCPE